MGTPAAGKPAPFHELGSAARRLMTTIEASPTEQLAGARSDDEERVLRIVRELARELGGARAAAVTPTASLERETGLGSLERVELLTRIESATGRELGDRFLLMDSVREIVLALPSAPASGRAIRAGSASPQAPTVVRADDVDSLPEVLARHASAEPDRVHVYLHEIGRAHV